MKNTLIALATLMAIAGSIPSVMAAPGFGPGMRGGPNVEYMARALDLTPEQQDKVKALFAEQAKKRSEMRTAMQTEMQAKMQSILTKEQYAKMTEMRQLRQGGPGSGMGGRGPGRNGGCSGMGPRGMK
jgi:Spy/CpxP family protein refolding chaperone